MPSVNFARTNYRSENILAAANGCIKITVRARKNCERNNRKCEKIVYYGGNRMGETQFIVSKSKRNAGNEIW